MPETQVQIETANEKTSVEDGAVHKGVATEPENFCPEEALSQLHNAILDLGTDIQHAFRSNISGSQWITYKYSKYRFAILSIPKKKQMVTVELKGVKEAVLAFSSNEQFAEVLNKINMSYLLLKQGVKPDIPLEDVTKPGFDLKKYLEERQAKASETAQVSSTEVGA